MKTKVRIYAKEKFHIFSKGETLLIAEENRALSIIKDWERCYNGLGKINYEPVK